MIRRNLKIEPGARVFVRPVYGSPTEREGAIVKPRQANYVAGYDVLLDRPLGGSRRVWVPANDERMRRN